MKDQKTQDKIDLSQIKTPEQLFELVASDKIKLAQLKTIIELHPGIVNSAIEAMQTIGSTSQAAGNSQVEAIRTIQESIKGTVEILKILALNSQSDSTREKIAESLLALSKQHNELCEIIERINKTNNKFWKRVAITIGTILAVVAGGSAAAAKLRE